MNNFYRTGLILFFILQTIFLYAQYKSSGIPFVNNFSPQEYKAGNQNWAITQDARGIMYFGNTDGIMEFDGTTWKIIDPMRALCFAKDRQERIFVGGRFNFGYLTPDSAGNIIFKSLIDLLPEQYKNVDHIWTIACVGSAVYFISTDEKIYVYESGKIKTLSIKGYMGAISSYNNQIFIEHTDGLCILKNDHLEKVKGGELVSRVNIRNMFDFGEDTLLIVTRSNGLFIYHQQEVTAWKTAVSPYIEDYQVYLATQLPNGFIGFGTVKSGVIIMNKQGEPTQHINRYGGMINDDHCGIFCDRQGNIWSGLEYGISYLHVNSRWSVYNELAGLPTATYYSVALHNDKIYAGNAQGLYSKSWKIKDNPLQADWKFCNQPGIDARKVWDIISIDNDLIFSSSNVGTYCLSDGNLYKAADYTAPFTFSGMSNKRKIIAGGEHTGIFLYQKNNKNRWEIISSYKDIGYLGYFKEDSQGHIWTCEDFAMIHEFELKGDSLVLLNSYDSTQGLPSDENYSLIKLYDRILVGTKKGSYFFDKKTNKFQPCDEVNAAMGPDVHITSILTDNNGKPWFWGFLNESELTGYFEKKPGEKLTCRLIIEPLKKIKAFTNSTFLPIDDHNMLIGSSNCLVHLDPTSTIMKPFFNALIRTVTLTNGSDSAIFNGTFLDQEGKMLLEQDNDHTIEIPYISNSLRINYSSNYYEDYNQNTYSYKMEGFDSDWSTWTKKTEKEYTNLPEGNYEFLVKTRNFYGNETLPASFSFTITPPWYRTYLAYFSYFIFLALFIYLIVKLSIRKVEKEKIKLEKIVQQRTEEVVRQKDEIVLKNSELEQQREEILSQNEVLSQQNEEISSQRDEIEAQRDIVVSQKNQIERIHKGVTDSINYAKKIQEALLPVSDASRSILGEHFILYKPKDIVSGDFYWISQINEMLIVAVADCTGHGVPGAFMSMLGITFLNEIIRKQEVTQANQVLNQLRSEIINALQQKGIHGEQKDGMDISLLVINTNTHECQWAGANNPLYIIKNTAVSSWQLAACLPVGKAGQNTPKQFPDRSQEAKSQEPIANSHLIEVKGDSMPVSIHPVMKDFTNHEFMLEEGDILYLMSDGYADQFGGVNHKKFFSKRLKELLVSISEKPMKEQKEILEATFENWKIDQDQIDDVTIIGLRYNNII
ncbi:MAG: hypothetical protein CVU05_07855 [Bacteroidetes bacterium HGW-Bacteroidetes-21]|jgi:serine phosphatase RsbU (regulator of sigma subunit)|nr:MAG: hypothetical protein CVU05_07855 [Bacteroidetes bacterium HGW-Bacteroidetes-21]